ncbi:MAG: DUF2851 family protein [Prevotellaceae bacterium]|jgi:hypothetical protein|nr:DUF2851 family protein [Prevotellaceae bacterium]
MREALLHYVWQYRLFSAHQLKTSDNKTVEIIDVGKLNMDAGPDFFNAKIKIDGTLWAGNVEIHHRSSDWVRHGHEKDKRYNNVILHVVRVADTDIFRQNGEKVPQLELQISEGVEQKAGELYRQNKQIACADEIASVPAIYIRDWKNALLAERLSHKTNEIEKQLKSNHNHWEEAFYVVLARNFGFGTNGQAFEQTAQSLPLSTLAKHKNNLFQMEALLFGQSGLLFTGEGETDEYVDRLREEHAFLAKKYRLKPVDGFVWKMARLRPDNFPHIRIAQFADLIHRSSKLFSKILKKKDLNDLKSVFDCKVSDYWLEHYRFAKTSSKKAKQLGKNAADTIIINTIVPFLYAYGTLKENQEYKDRASAFLEQLKPEENSVIKQWHELNIPVDNAADSQALLHLKKQYCEDKKCLYCRIGHKILKMNHT